MIPQLTLMYQDKNGAPVANGKHPDHHYTVINGSTRTRRDGPPQRLVGKAWVDITPDTRTFANMKEAEAALPAVAEAAVAVDPATAARPKKKR